MRSTRRTLTAAIATACALATVTACGGGSGSSSSGSSSTYTFWDPYPQFDASSDWGKRVTACGTEAGVKVKRTAYDTTDLGNKALLAAQQGNAPDVMLVDNPVVSTLVEVGILTRTSDLGLDTAAIQKNIIGAGTLDNAAYGIPIGANTLALYYNKKVLSAAHVDPAGIKDWPSSPRPSRRSRPRARRASPSRRSTPRRAASSSCRGSGAPHGDLTRLDSPKGVAALTLWKQWVDAGYAPKDVLNNTQTTSWQEFATGDYAFGENGTWQLANAEKAGFPYGIVNIPAQNGGSAPVPTGGEFVTVPVQKDTGRYDTTKKIVGCLTSAENLLASDTTLTYVAPTAAVQAQQVKANAKLKPWVDAVAAARGRTSGGLGTKYPTISQPMWTAVQAALSGSKSPAAALSDAQTAASKG